MRCKDFDRVSGLEDLEADKAAATSLPGRMDDKSYGNPESRSDVTANQHITDDDEYCSRSRAT